ncbi:TetR/AcrR family transcriptional regulator [Ruegeria sp. SCSIO 43209]|uniref:TetR/AcrR family transcriptional regulator n=1 Tax=Ruegeria sp. SCSIO 43209 TaxID=2793010 RepID=UPI001CAA3424|nr:TetR/AcrR family transcriptional regulator [Ruegeria sp. SCSIO 43209]UAB87880.1 TetR/AcrR family transcriptional regulator [Ruegeria sp. SCSIO 43209]
MSDDTKKPESIREKATAKRRNQILEAAVMCFLERGYHQTGVRDIAARAGVSLGNLYNHFRGKHDVLVEIAILERREMEPFLKILNSNAPAPKVIRKFIKAYAKYLAAPENVILTLEISSEAVRQPDIAQLFVENRSSLTEALEAVVKRGITGGELRTVPDPLQASQLVIEVLEGSAYRSVLSEMPMTGIIVCAEDFIMSSLLARH